MPLVWMSNNTRISRLQIQLSDPSRQRGVFSGYFNTEIDPIIPGEVLDQRDTNSEHFQFGGLQRAPLSFPSVALSMSLHPVLLIKRRDSCVVSRDCYLTQAD